MTKISIPHKPFYFIRHGQTDWNKEYRAMGHTDIPLNQNGLEQALLAADFLKNIQFDRIISSPLSRALKTAEIIAEQKEASVHIVDGFKECSMGILEGENLLFDARVQAWEKGAYIENAEHYHDFSNRVMQGLVQALSGSDIPLIVSHGGVYRIIQIALGLPHHGLKNCVPIFHKPVEQLDGVWDIQIL